MYGMEQTCHNEDSSSLVGLPVKHTGTKALPTCSTQICTSTAGPVDVSLLAEMLSAVHATPSLGKVTN